MKTFLFTYKMNGQMMKDYIKKDVNKVLGADQKVIDLKV